MCMYPCVSCFRFCIILYACKFYVTVFTGLCERLCTYIGACVHMRVCEHIVK